MLGSIIGYLLPALVVYVLLVSRARFERLDSLLWDYALRHGLRKIPSRARTAGRAPTRAELPMTPSEAQRIVQLTSTLELPFTVEKALEAALAKTYGIATIAKLLRATGELGKSATAGKRYVDTAVLISSFITYPLHGDGSGAEHSPLIDPRNALAVARMNHLHDQYNISNDDFLYTLSVFIFEPPKFCTRFEWRSMSPVEEMALFVFWSEIGRRMGIEGIPAELQDLINWAEAYEVTFMKPNEACRDVAVPTIKLLLHHVPQRLHALGTMVASALLDDRLRAAIMLPDPPTFLPVVVRTLLKARGLMIRYCFLPRSLATPYQVLDDPFSAPAFPSSYDPLAKGATTKGDKKFAPRSTVRYSNNEPWYEKSPTGLKGSIKRALLRRGYLRQDQVAGTFQPEGFRIEELGPGKFVAAGHDIIMAKAAEMQGAEVEGYYAVGGVDQSRCPMGFS